MRILVADDDPVSRLVVRRLLERWGHTAEAAPDGQAAWDILRGPAPPPVAVLDWSMPGLTGPEVCALARSLPRPPYLLLLTALEEKDALAVGLDAGANDFIRKPFEESELRARVGVGVRVAELEARLADRVAELERSLSQVRRLSGLLPMCAWCKAVRNDQDYWQRLEEYLAEQAGTRTTHGICPACLERLGREMEAHGGPA